jgi:hypothetical protein
MHTKAIKRFDRPRLIVKLGANSFGDKQQGTLGGGIGPNRHLGALASHCS